MELVYMKFGALVMVSFGKGEIGIQVQIKQPRILAGFRDGCFGLRQ
jgi:hypothetical protein